MLNPEQMRAHPTARPLTTASLAELTDAWTAITSPDPEALLSLLSEPMEALPYLIPSLRTLLDRYPHHKIGLNRAEVTLLRNVQEHGPRAITPIGRTLIASSGHDLWNDAWLFSRLLHLGSKNLPAPALDLSGDTATMRTCEARLTEVGSRLLSQELNFVDLNGIDDWVLGVRLDSAQGSVWFRTADSLVQRGL